MGGSTLILMRHAKSDWPEDGRRDFDRPLARRGEKDAPRMGKWLRRNGLVPDKVVSSPAVRAHDTARFVAGKLHIPARRIVLDERIYEAGLGQLCTVITAHGKDSETLLVVGHNPGFEDLLTHLAIEPPARNEQGKLLTAGAVAVLEFTGAIAGARGSARLRVLVRPRELRALEKTGDA